jgi:hypothetical protein
MRRSTRLHEASTKTFPSPPPTPPLPLASDVSMPTPLPTMMVEPPSEGLDIAWQRWREEIRKFNRKYFDNQEGELCDLQCSCEEFDEGEFEKGEYGTVEMMSLEEVWWLQECFHDAFHDVEGGR